MPLQEIKATNAAKPSKHIRHATSVQLRAALRDSGCEAGGATRAEVSSSAPLAHPSTHASSPRPPASSRSLAPNSLSA